MPKFMQQNILNAKVKVFFKAYFKTPLFVIPKLYLTFYLLFYKYGTCCLLSDGTPLTFVLLSFLTFLGLSGSLIFITPVFPLFPVAHPFKKVFLSSTLSLLF